MGTSDWSTSRESQQHEYFDFYKFSKKLKKAENSPKSLKNKTKQYRIYFLCFNIICEIEVLSNLRERKGALDSKYRKSIIMISPHPDLIVSEVENNEKM